MVGRVVVVVDEQKVDARLVAVNHKLGLAHAIQIEIEHRVERLERLLRLATHRVEHERHVLTDLVTVTQLICFFLFKNKR